MQSSLLIFDKKPQNIIAKMKQTSIKASCDNLRKIKNKTNYINLHSFQFEKQSKNLNLSNYITNTFEILFKDLKLDTFTSLAIISNIVTIITSVINICNKVSKTGITILITSITTLILQLISISKIKIETKDVENIIQPVEELLTDFSDSDTEYDTLYRQQLCPSGTIIECKRPKKHPERPIFNNMSEFVYYVRNEIGLDLKIIEDIYDYNMHYNLNFRNLTKRPLIPKPFKFTETTEQLVSYYKKIAYLLEFYGEERIFKIWKLNATQILHIKYIKMEFKNKNNTNPKETKRDLNLSASSCEDIGALITDEELQALFDGKMQRQIKTSPLVKLITTIGTTIIGLFVTVFFTSKGKNFDFGMIQRNLQGLDFVGTKISDIVESVTTVIEGEKEDITQKLVFDYALDLQKAMEVPESDYIKNLSMRKQLSEKLKHVAEFMRVPVDPKVCNNSILTSTYSLASKFYLSIEQAAKTSTIRQETRIILFAGTGGVGKTKSMRAIAKRIGGICYGDIEPQNRITEMSPSSKYYPVLKGEPIWMCDEVGSSKNYENDLIMRNIRGLCSPARYGADTAEIVGKNQGAEVKLVIGTTNTPLDVMMNRIADISGAEACAPSASRMHIFTCYRNEASYGKLDLANRDLQSYDTSGKFRHVIYKLNTFSDTTKKYVEQPEPYTFEQVCNYIMRIQNTMQEQYEKEIAQDTFEMNQYRMERQSTNSKNHYVINLFGKPYAGKGQTIDQILPTLKKTFNYPITHINKEFVGKPMKFKERHIIVIDDICPMTKTNEFEEWYMQLYNSYLINGSIIIIATNIIPYVNNLSFNLIPAGLTIFNTHIPYFYLEIKPKLKNIFNEAGFLRRFGFRGNYDTPTHAYGTNMFVQYDMLYDQSETKFLNIQIYEIISLVILSNFSKLLIIPFLFYYLLKYINSVKIVPIDKFEMQNKILEDYKTFINKTTINTVLQNSVPTDFIPEIRIDTDRLITLIGVSPTEFMSYVYLDFSKFIESKSKLKIFVNTSLLNTLQQNYHRFTNFNPSPTSESVVEFLSLISKLMSTGDHSPQVAINVEDTGSYYLKDRIIYRNDIEINNNYTIIDDGVQILFNNSIIHIKFLQISQFLINKVPPFDFNKFSGKQIKEISNILQNNKIITHPSVLQYNKEIIDSTFKTSMFDKCSKIKEEFKSFSQTLFGKVCLVIIVGLSTLLAASTLYSWLKPKPRRQSERYTLYRHGKFEEETESEEEEELLQQRKRIGLRNKPRAPTDLEDNIYQRKKNTLASKPRTYNNLSDFETRKQKKTLAKPRTYNNLSDFETRKQKKSQLRNKPRDCRNLSDFETNMPSKVAKQMVKTLPPMNNHTAGANLIRPIANKVEKNECQVITSLYTDSEIRFTSKQEFDNYISKNNCAYGLFVMGKELITVGHIPPKANVYIAADNFGLRIIKADLVKNFSKEVRDFSIWTIGNNSKAKDIPAFKDITNCFADKIVDQEYHEVIMKRYGTMNTPEYLYGGMRTWTNSYTSKDVEGQTYTIANFGVTDFGTKTFALTEVGDCGLPYYTTNYVNGTPQVKIIGVHCMGNPAGTRTTGVCALIVKSDFSCLRMSKQFKDNSCQFCTGNISIEDPLEEKRINPFHKIVWNNEHPTSLNASLREIQYYFSQYGNRYPLAIHKNSGPLAQGTVEHSHTHIIPDHHYELNKPQQQWYEEYIEKFEMNVLTKTYLVANMRTLEKSFNEMSFVDDFTLKINFNKDNIVVQIRVLSHSLLQEEYDNLITPAMRYEISKPLFDNEYIFPGLDRFHQLINQDKTPTMPLKKNETVQLCGTLPFNASHTPSPNYDRITFVDFETKEEKEPFNTNPDIANDEQFAQILIDNKGNNNQLVTQIAQYQNPVFDIPILDKKHIYEQLAEGYKEIYSECREATDKEVLHGFSGELNGGMSGLEVNKSIGITLKTLFHCTKKSDVISVDENGVYRWENNPAADFLREWYKGAKTAIRQGKRIRAYYLDLLKMEKLKLSKSSIGRAFCCCDMLEILITRKFAGQFLARSTLFDDVVGVGSNPWKVFNEMANKLRQKKNYFTGDFKRWDKVLPKAVVQAVACALDEVNTVGNKTHQQIFNMFNQSFHVCNDTVLLILLGMPSGSLLTANANSKCNEAALFIAFVCLGIKHGLLYDDLTWEIFNELVYRKIYGDDIIVGVDDSIIEWFNMVNIKIFLKEQLGFNLDSSEKDGKVTKFMDWSELSWCSRYFRKLLNYDYTVGALKKSTINSMLHYRKKSSDDYIYATTINNALLEAALWERDYFDMVVRDVRKIKLLSKVLKDNIVILTYEEYQEEAYSEGMFFSLIKHSVKIVEETECRDECSNIAPEDYNLTKQNKQTANDLLIYQAKFLKQASELIKQNSYKPKILMDNNIDYISYFNILHQKKLIEKPTYNINNIDNIFYCTATIIDNTGKSHTSIATANNKKTAKQSALSYFYNHFSKLN